MDTESADTKPSTTAQGGRTRSRSARQRGLILVGLLLGFALRLHGLGAESLWYDETVSVYLARQSIPDLIAHTARDIHPPGYYLLLHFWHLLTQPSLIHGLEFLYAWPSLFAGMLLLPLIYAVGRKLFDPFLALLALWIAAVHPFHLWYSQEVRMYTLGAALGMLCLWAVVMWQRTAEDGGGRTKDRSAGALRPRRRVAPTLYLFVYVLAAAAGLYTLYYFSFLLIVLNLWIAGSVISYQLSVISPQSPVPSPQSPVPNLFAWTLAQLAVIGLWLPWLPTFWRQATEPPVPPWRGDVDGLAVLRETLAAVLVGQTPPLGQDLLWAGIAALILVGAFLGYANRRIRGSVMLLFVYTFAPLLLIYLISVWVTPLYHIRYLFTYAAPLPLLLALGLRTWTAHRRPLLAAGLALIFTVSAWSLADFWTHPLYRADDHRSAVADLAAAWRPGDAIFVNAGWVYPILEVYWPQELHSAADALPPLPAQRTRMIGYTNKAETTPTLITTGSVDGSPTLGWGLAESDFYPMPRAEALAALDRLAEAHPRIWHYRLYDTVSDPAGDLRARLDERAEMIWDQPYPGRDYVRVQLFETPAATEEGFCLRHDKGVDFDDALRLTGVQTTSEITAGSVLYATLCWEAGATVNAFPDGLRASLRLYASTLDGEILVAQADAAPLRPTTTWQPGERYRQPLALPISVATPPGSYDLALIVYNGSDGTPLSLRTPAAFDGQRWPLGEVEVDLPPSPPRLRGSLARFDYIDLLSAATSEEIRPGGFLDVATIWRPRPNDYRDTYDVIFTLTGMGTSQDWQRRLGGAGYPSGDWPVGYPVEQQHQLPLSADLPPGEYQLSVRLARASDGLTIPVHGGFLPWAAEDSFLIGAVAVK